MFFSPKKGLTSGFGEGWVNHRNLNYVQLCWVLAELSDIRFGCRPLAYVVSVSWEGWERIWLEKGCLGM